MVAQRRKNQGVGVGLAKSSNDLEIGIKMTFSETVGPGSSSFRRPRPFIGQANIEAELRLIEEAAILNVFEARQIGLRTP